MKAMLAAASGWEYDLLRSLSPETAATLLQSATRRGFPALLFSPWHLLFAATVGSHMIGLWVVGQMLGLGWLGGIVLEVVVLHATLEPIIRRGYPHLLKPFVRDELLAFARSQLHQAPPYSTREDQP